MKLQEALKIVKNNVEFMPANQVQEATRKLLAVAEKCEEFIDLFEHDEPWKEVAKELHKEFNGK